MRDVVGALVITFPWLIIGSVIGLSLVFILAGIFLTGVVAGTIMEIAER